MNKVFYFALQFIIHINKKFLDRATIFDHHRKHCKEFFSEKSILAFNGTVGLTTYLHQQVHKSISSLPLKSFL